jgi:hypothetical protein
LLWSHHHLCHLLSELLYFLPHLCHQYLLLEKLLLLVLALCFVFFDPLTFFGELGLQSRHTIMIPDVSFLEFSLAFVACKLNFCAFTIEMLIPVFSQETGAAVRGTGNKDYRTLLLQVG